MVDKNKRFILNIGMYLSGVNHYLRKNKWNIPQMAGINLLDGTDAYHYQAKEPCRIDSKILLLKKTKSLAGPIKGAFSTLAL